MARHSRAEWNALPPKSPQPPLHLVQFVALHHIGAGPGWPTDVAATLRGIQSYEQNHGYVDIAYCAGVDHNGEDWELRGDVKDGATLGYSGSSWSLLVIANGDAAGFTVPQKVVDGIIASIRAAQKRGVVASNPHVFIEGHKWFDAHITPNPTGCPYPKIEDIVGAVQVGVQLTSPVQVPQISAVPDNGESMQFYDKVNPSKPNRTRSVTVTPGGLIFRSNGGRLGPHDYTDDTIKPFNTVKFYDLPSTFGPGETYVGCNYHPDGSNALLYQSRLGDTGELADHKLVFTADGP